MLFTVIVRSDRRSPPPQINRRSIVDMQISYEEDRKLELYSAIEMRINYIYVLLLGVSASCAPLSSSPGTHGKLHGHDEMDVQTASPHNGLKTGAIAGLSIAGILGASIGITEYISSLYHRFSGGKMESQNDVEGNKFQRDRSLADEDFQDAGLDVVLNLVEKYAQKQETPVAVVPKNESDEESERETGTDEIKKIEEMPLPLPRLPGHPPLSEFEGREHLKIGVTDRRAVDKIETDTEGKDDLSDEEKKQALIGNHGCSLHPICRKFPKKTQ